MFCVMSCDMLIRTLTLKTFIASKGRRRRRRDGVTELKLYCKVGAIGVNARTRGFPEIPAQTSLPMHHQLCDPQAIHHH